MNSFRTAPTAAPPSGGSRGAYRQLPLYPDLALTLVETGTRDGRPVVVLHGAAGPASMAGLIKHLSVEHRVFAPTHPGWDNTDRPHWCSGVDDLAIAHLDLLDGQGLRDVVVVGRSFGRWVAAEMAIRDRGSRIAALVLLDAIGPEIPGHAMHIPDGKAPQVPGPAPQALKALRIHGGPSLHDAKPLRRLGRSRHLPS
ncbi:alpha/beta fold hydrolase [Streptomyces sioyaensis]|uniref:alpha/beta fold hydrolase n=1 Tax=Streptomyces sioyaensis TaxID=67364 RepID=UPI0037BBA2A4